MRLRIGVVSLIPTPLHLDESTEENGPIKEIEVSTVRQEPYTLPEKFLWSDIDIHVEAQLAELHTLLGENYVEDDACTFRFAYSPEFLQW